MIIYYRYINLSVRHFYDKRFATFVDRDGKLKITMSPGASGRPTDLGNYTQDDLKAKDSKARRAIIVKLREITTN